MLDMTFRQYPGGVSSATVAVLHSAAKHKLYNMEHTKKNLNESMFMKASYNNTICFDKDMFN